MYLLYNTADLSCCEWAKVSARIKIVKTLSIEADKKVIFKLLCWIKDFLAVGEIPLFES